MFSRPICLSRFTWLLESWNPIPLNSDNPLSPEKTLPRLSNLPLPGRNGNVGTDAPAVPGHRALIRPIDREDHVPGEQKAGLLMREVVVGDGASFFQLEPGPHREPWWPCSHRRKACGRSVHFLFLTCCLLRRNRDHVFLEGLGKQHAVILHRCKRGGHAQIHDLAGWVHGVGILYIKAGLRPFCY